MKLLTLNTHSADTLDLSERLSRLCDVIAREAPDIIAFQEVCQQNSAAVLPQEQLRRFVPCGRIPIKQDNFAHRAVCELSRRGVYYHWTWLGMKLGYERFDEGLALLCRGEIHGLRYAQVSGCGSYRSWKRRMILGVRTSLSPQDWFFCVHLGRWDDPEEPFCEQWSRLCAALPESGRMWLLGDFNAPSERRSESLDLMLSQGWQDCFAAAEKRSGFATVGGRIDGWSDSSQAMRIDYILCSRKTDIRTARVILNGTDCPAVSDHFGLLIE
ncbi:MAG: endonuclease/exonuclease/phosphatase family protein [Oscillospiraceae bacterium]